jgi:hypothetical protein
MSDKETIQKLQELLEDSNIKVEEYLEIYKYLKKIYKEDHDDKEFRKLLKDLKKELDELEFSKKFENNKRSYFDKDIKSVKKLCDTVNIDYKDLNDDELYELLLKPETVLMFKHRLFENIKLHIKEGNKKFYEYLSSCDEYLNEYSGTPIFDSDYTIDYLIKFYMEGFRRFYIFKFSEMPCYVNPSILQNFIGNGLIDITDIECEIYEEKIYKPYYEE